ncbi:MAG: hypothetical protein J6X48_12445 [Lachnospiraceae bacterium]|nr:hypothetical protein [Lachnospiraceae bacterium]
MNKSDFNKELFSNIEISNRMKKELYENCKRGKRAGDFRFRYAGALTALIGVIVFGCTGAASYAYYQSVQMRMEAMPETEIHEYALDLENDTGVTIDDAYSRKLSDEEALKVAELERKYNAEGQYPEGDVARVATLAEWDGKSVCYVEEDHKLHLPETMTDEDLLEFIDYSTKKDYVMEQEAKEVTDNTPSPYVTLEGTSEADLVKAARPALEKLFGNDVASGWNTRVEAFKPSATDPSLGTSHDMYFIYWEQVGGSSNSTDYVVVINMDDSSIGAVAVRGREHFASLESFTDAEAESRLKADLPKVLSELERLYGYKNPVIETEEVCYDYTDYGENDARQLRYVFNFNGTTVDVMWDLGTEKLASVEFFNE